MKYLTEKQMQEIVMKVALSLNGLPVGQARAILDEAKEIITNCSDVDIHNERFEDVIQAVR